MAELARQRFGAEKFLVKVVGATKVWRREVLVKVVGATKIWRREVLVKVVGSTKIWRRGLGRADGVLRWGLQVVSPGLG